MAHLNRNILDLKSIRIEESNSEDDQDFEGFKIGETIEHRDWVDNQMGRLHALASPSTEVSVIKSISAKDDFIGFDNYETKKHKFWTANQVCNLRKFERERELSVLRQEDTDDSESHYSDSDETASPNDEESSGISVPKPTPRENSDSEVIFICEDEAAGPSTPSKDRRSDILVPKSLVPYEDSDSEMERQDSDSEIIFMSEEDKRKEDNPQENTENPITYSIRNEKTVSGKKVINCSKGHTYSFQKESRVKKSGQPPVYKYFKCIKRQSTPGKKEENCAARLRVEKFDEGENNMIVIPRGPQHNHGQSSSNYIKKSINTELRNLTKNFPNMETKLLINSVINNNENFKKFYEQNS